MLTTRSSSHLRERLLVALFVFLGISWILGLVLPLLSLVGAFAAGFAFMKFRAGTRRSSLGHGALSSAGALALILLPVLVVVWFITTATTSPGEAGSIFEAFVDLDGDGDRLLALAAFFAGSVVLGASGGALATWVHNRQLDGEYWVESE